MKQLTEILGIKHPIILAPMFLISNARMTIAAIQSGITAAIPALNYRTTDELRAAIREIKAAAEGPFGINLIVNKSNFRLHEQLQVCCEEKVAFIITSLGSPKETINKAHASGIKVFCDVTDVKYAKKVESQGADGVIAVSREAGGHAGTASFRDLIADLKANCSIPVISAGGVGNKATYEERMSLGVSGVSVGSIFIASEESPVTAEYKQACIDFGAKDIVMTTKLSGTPCTVINTPYVQEIGTEQTWIEAFLNKNKRIKKWIKALTFIRGMKSLQQAAFGHTYKTVWCAGPSIEHVHAVRPVKEIVSSLL
ncbi:MAG: 2-nitropropane dioxygenase [Crocinitomicaceae bacterium]|jgi:nitronate monooxygenase|nr:2-nitropropane dioxygenase [Crocinitomicaceae bacterium]